MNYRYYIIRSLIFKDLKKISSQNILKKLEIFLEKIIIHFPCGLSPNIFYNEKVYIKVLMCQRQVRKWIKNRKARIIQRNCNNWIDKPITKDGKLGISMRLFYKNCMGKEVMYPEKIEF